MKRFIFVNHLTFSVFIVIALVCAHLSISHATDLNGVVDTNNMPTAECIKNHIRWTKIVISSSAGEKMLNIESNTKAFNANNVGQPDSVMVAWTWKLADGIPGNDVSYGLLPIEVKDISGTVGFTFYDLGTIHGRFINQIEKQTKRKNFSEANEQIEIANDFYSKIRGLNNAVLSKQVNSWNYALYQAAFNEAHQGGLRLIEGSEKAKVRLWIKEWINLCIEHQELRPRLVGALQSWSKFTKLAYSRVSDWPDTIPQDITDEEVNRVFLKPEFRDWMIEDMDWLLDEVFKNEIVRPALEGQPKFTALVPNDRGVGTSLSKFAQAITDFAREWK